MFHLNNALEDADGPEAEEIQAILDLIGEDEIDRAQARLDEMIGAGAASLEQGADLFAANCEPCHGPDGVGGLGPRLQVNPFVQSLSDEGMTEFLLTGRGGTAMAGFEGRLSEEQLASIVALLRTWQP